MIQLVLKRLGSALVIIFLALAFIFTLANEIGDPATATLGPNASPQAKAEFRHQHGLDQPLASQFGSYLAGVAHGDLGDSYRDRQPVTTVIMTRLPRTLLLISLAVFLEICLGLSLGIIAATRRNTWFDTGFMAMAFLGISVPSFLSGLVFLYVFGFRLGWFPIGGYGVGLLDHLRHAMLPAFTLAIIGSATYARIMRSEMIETLSADYVRTAKAKGLGPVRVVLSHAARNALLPIVTLLGLRLPFLVTGAIITEQIFNWPGMGRLVIECITALDVPMILGVFFVTAVAVQVGNLLADIAVGALDPRVRVGKG